MLERTLRSIAHNVHIYFHQDYQDMSWDRASSDRASPISASAGHGERGTYSAFHTGTADSNPGIYSAIYFKSKSTFPFPKNFNQIVHDTNIRHKLLEYLELIFWLEADSKEKWRWTEGFRSHKTGLTGFSFCCSMSIWWKDPHSSKRFKNRDRPTN